MKLKLIQIMNTGRCCILLMAFVWLAGCATSNPLADWKIDWEHEPDRVISKDYHDYIQKLPLEQRNAAGGGIMFLKDGSGQHAIMIPIGINGTVWRHVLIYDQNEKRIKTIRYASGDYRS